MPGRLALSALVTLFVAQAGCATRLDFDSVSAGRDAARDSRDELDAASAPTSDGSSRGPADAGAQADARVEDAGQSLLDAGHTDRPLDAGAGAIADAGGQDAGGAAPDALPPASDASVDPRTFSCAKQTPAPLLCYDFEAIDDPSLPNATYIVPQDPAAGSIGRDDHAARGGRGALLATVNPQVSTCFQCDLNVCVWWAFREFQGHQLVTIDFDVRVDEVDLAADHHSALFRFSFGNDERGYSFHDLRLRSSAGGVEASFIEFDRDGKAPGSTGEPQTRGTSYDWKPWPGRLLDWVHVRYELDALDTNASGNTVRVSVGNRLLADDVLVNSLRHLSPTLELGFPVVDMAEFVEGETNGSWQARFDNLLVRVEPR